MNSYPVLILALVASMPASAQQMYRCGNTFSQTPCAADAKEVKVQVAPACQDEKNRYTDACIQQRLKELSSPDTVQSSKQARETQARAQAQVDAAKKQPAPAAEVVDTNLRACEARIRNSMKDPEAARISEGGRQGPTLNYVKGQMRTEAAVLYTFKVNGKNSYGGYTGNKLYSCVLALDEKTILEVKESGAYPG